MPGIIYQNRNGRIVAANKGRRADSQDSRARAARLDAFYPVACGCTLMAARWHPKSTPRCGRWPSRVLCGVRMVSPLADSATGSVGAVPQFRPGETAPFQIFVVFEDITERVNIDPPQAARHRL